MKPWIIQRAKLAFALAGTVWLVALGDHYRQAYYPIRPVVLEVGPGTEPAVAFVRAAGIDAPLQCASSGSTVDCTVVVGDKACGVYCEGPACRWSEPCQ